MRTRALSTLLLSAVIGSCSAGDNSVADGHGRVDGSTDGHRDGAQDATLPDTGPPVCHDTDGDTISDSIEGAPTQHTSLDPTAPPDYMNLDSDGDTISDQNESFRNYAGYESMALTPLTCGQQPDDCDSDGLQNWRDRDSDNDGLTDQDEVAHHTNPCVADTDGDGVPDLIEVAAGSDPTDPHSTPPASDLYVTLPFEACPPGAACDPPTSMTPNHQHRQFDFATRFHAADIFFIVDTTGSMATTITALRSSLTSTIVPGITAALGSGADARFGVADFRSFPISPDGSPGSDYVLWMRQPLTHTVSSVLSAINTMVAAGGGDEAEPSTEAIYQTISGAGEPGHLADATPHAGAPYHAPNAGFAGAMNPTRDCAYDPMFPSSAAFGWGCFQPGRVPIIVLFSDANWIYDRNAVCGGAPCSTYPAASFTATGAALTMHGAYFVGVDVGSYMGTFPNAQAMARLSGTLDAAGNPIAYDGPPSSIATNVVNAVTTLAQGTRQDITRRVDPDTTEMRLMAPHTTADFLKAVRPDHATPMSAIVRMDDTTFYGVQPVVGGTVTTVTFDADFYNDFQHNTSGTVQLFHATIVVLGRAMTVLDTHPVFIVVPTDANAPPG